MPEEQGSTSAAQPTTERGEAPVLPAHWRRGAVAVGLLAVLGYLVVVALLDREALLSALARITPATLILILLLSLLNYVLRFVRWQHFLSRAGHRVPLWRHVLIYQGGFVMALSPGRVGQAVRSVYLQWFRVPLRTSFAALFGELFFDLLGVMLLALLLFATEPEYLPYVLSGLALMVAAAAILLMPRLYDWLLQLLFRLPLLAARTAFQEWVQRFSHDCRAVLGTPWALVWLLLTLVAWAAEGYGVVLLTQDLGYGLPVLQVVGVYSMALLVGAAAFLLPAGLGGMEAAMAALLVVLGLTLADAIVVTLLCRLATLWFAILLGAMALTVLEILDHPGGERRA